MERTLPHDSSRSTIRPCPTSRLPLPTSSRPSRRSPTSTATAWSSTTRPASARGIRDLAWTAAFTTDEADHGRRPVAGLGGEPGARRPLRQHPRAVRGARPRRGVRVHRARDQHPRPDVRHGAHRLRGRRAVGRRHGDPRAGAKRADLHVPAPDRLRDGGPRRGGRRELAGARSSSRATTTSSTPRSTPPTRRR